MKRLKLAAGFIAIGLVMGIIILHPLTMIIYWYEFRAIEETDVSIFGFVWEKMSMSFSGKMLIMTVIFSLIGSFIGGFFWLFSLKLSKKNDVISRLKNTLDRNLNSLIKEGENEYLEFKSSARWDYKLKKSNKVLEAVIIKTIAGFMNNKGGTLLIGIADDGNTIGIEKDILSLKRRDKDGYEQFIIGIISDKLGADLCSIISVLFHKLNDKDVCQVVVEPATKPVYCREKDNVNFYLRTGGGTRPLNVQEANNYITKHWKR